jgi:hypothetical protein
MKKLTTLTAGLLLAIAALALPASAAAKDRNHDRIPDRWERHFKLSLNVNQAHRNQDRDGLDNMQEFKAGDNPRNADTDGDGIPDGQENAGTIASFDSSTGKLVINLFNGDTISGMVTSSTEIECNTENEAENEQENENGNDREDGGGNSGPSNSGSSENEGSGSQGEDGDGQGEDDNGTACTTADLTPGTNVHEAELELANGAATFKKVELVK